MRTRSRCPFESLSSTAFAMLSISSSSRKPSMTGPCSNSSSSNTRRTSISPYSPSAAVFGIFMAHRIASSREATSMSQYPATRFSSSKGPSMTVLPSAENLIRKPSEVGLSPTPSSITPARTSSWLYASTPARSSSDGITPASEALVAFTRITNFMTLMVRGYPDRVPPMLYASLAPVCRFLPIWMLGSTDVSFGVSQGPPWGVIKLWCSQDGLPPALVKTKCKRTTRTSAAWGGTERHEARTDQHGMAPDDKGRHEIAGLMTQRSLVQIQPAQRFLGH